MYLNTEKICAANSYFLLLCALLYEFHINNNKFTFHKNKLQQITLTLIFSTYSAHEWCICNLVTLKNDKMINLIVQTHISIFIDVRHILVTICRKAVCGDFFYTMYDRFGSVHLTGAFHNTMRHEVGDSYICHAIRNVHRRFVGTFRWLQDIWRVTTRFPRWYGAASTRTADAGSEQRRGITSMDWRGDWTGSGAAATGSRPADGRRSCGRIWATAGVGAVHNLDELSTFEHEHKVGIALKKAWI